ncbi:MAG: NADH-quinone oxidoreductase subunit, partial [Micromonosporaceae bacterium]|nr:NADH-quinone oxidoreductase subunit [Micromonosporaceae bacterium]
QAQAHGTTFTVGSTHIHAPGWYAILLIPSFLIYFVSAVGETNRAPFDLPEAESELVGGFHTEYSSLKFALFFLAEYIIMVTVSALCTTLFLGGWRAPAPITTVWGGANSGYVPIAWFVVKVLLLLFVFVWLRGTMPRLRYDQFMKLGWKVLIPLNLLWILALAGLRTVQNSSVQNSLKLFVALAVLVVIAAVWVFWPTTVGPDIEVGIAGVDPHGRIGGDDGFPVPPLDLQVPPSPAVPRLTAEREPVPVGSAIELGDVRAGATGPGATGPGATGPRATGPRATEQEG